MSEKDLAKEIWEHRNDPEEWSEETEDIEVRPRRSSVLSFRLPPEELAALEQAMEHTGESLSEFVRKALAMRLHGSQMEGGSTVGITYGAYGVPAELMLRDQDELMINNAVRLLMGSPTMASYVSRCPTFEDDNPLGYAAGTYIQPGLNLR